MDKIFPTIKVSSEEKGSTVRRKKEGLRREERVDDRNLSHRDVYTV